MSDALKRELDAMIDEINKNLWEDRNRIILGFGKFPDAENKTVNEALAYVYLSLLLRHLTV